ncbi:double-strand break repair protein AddB [Sphingomonas lenta]|uniref:Double-strand break repair protein AddB n=1 Tax=Sphingomonas lenta TaxID=1141887 RepID=A0A2A2SJV0_9SPHN|nr:double-strand break repair protein AddB [Sphingomonas lenta]PAX09495.1 double-strand break repair protein AddB [Sphingomonas lenta]
MAEARKPRVYTIPAHRAFADSLVAGLMKRYGDEPGRIARGIILLPNNRSVRAITEAFVRASGGGLLLPRMVALGDPDIGEGVGAALDPVGDDPVPPAVPPMRRRMMLARLIAEERARRGAEIDAGEAVRLAGELARTLDQMRLEEIEPERLRELDLTPELSEHWQRSLELFEVILDRWPDELARLGMIDPVDRRSRLISRLSERWAVEPPAGFVCAAGVTDSSPCVSRLMRCVASMRDGTVVFAGLATAMPDEEWDSLGPHEPDPDTGRARRSIETHPQFGLKVLLDRMGVNRAEVATWPYGSDHDASAARGKAIQNALAPAEATGAWSALRPEERRLAGVRAAEFPTPAAEAQGIALAMREVLETPGRTAALVTPDRKLARRVGAHLKRWGVEADDSAGRPLAILPPGTFLLALADAAAQRFPPLSLLTLLKHPLVKSGEGRGEWLRGARALDQVLRGPRPAPGLEGIDGHLQDPLAPDGKARAIAMDWWPTARTCLEPVARTYGDGPQPLGAFVACLREAAQALCGEAIWARPEGRCAAEFLADLERESGHGPRLIDPQGVAPLLRTLLDEQAVRPPFGGHPRLAIYGQIEARLQSADLMILGGLNEGVWPGIPAPDPWLAPRIRQELGLPGLERRVGLAAHDFGQALGAPQALITRARRDESAPTLASRFWLRLEALAGERFERAYDLEGWAEAIDDPGDFKPADRPAPSPPADLRPDRISVTEVDRLKADPYAFYARRVLGLNPLEPVDADPSARWRGTAVHLILEQWFRHDRADPAKLPERARALMEDELTHPMIRALWSPRLMEAVEWIASTVAEAAAEGRRILSVEGSGGTEIAGVTLTGRYDRIDRLPDGSLGVIDYKTGQAPSTAAVKEGFSMQLGMLGVIAERGGFPNVEGRAKAFEYWSLAKFKEGFGRVVSPVHPSGERDRIVTDEFTTRAAAQFVEAARKWLTGEEPFTAKLVPEYAPYAEYDQLMRRDEWYGRVE